MKKLISLFLLFSMTLCFCSCHYKTEQEKAREKTEALRKTANSIYGAYYDAVNDCNELEDAWEEYQRLQSRLGN